MNPVRQFKKVHRHLRNEGVVSTTREVADYCCRTIAGTLEGRPGYHRLRVRLLTRQYDSNAITPVWVSPNRITHLSGGYERRDSGHLDYVPQFKPREAGWESLPYEQEVPYGTVKGGDWDQRRAEFTQLLMYCGAQERFQDGLAWEDTVYYAELVSMFRSNGWDHDDAISLATERCEKIESLAEILQQTGYQSQKQLNGHPLHEVTVNVSREGDLLYNCEGRHRLCLAKILDIERIPVLVLIRHELYDGQDR